MNVDQHKPPQGTVRDWLDMRADGSAGADHAYVFVDGQPPLSWRELRDAARGLALDLTASGIPKGDSVAVMMPNGPDALVGLFGALYGGFRATMINLIAGDEAISYALDHSGAEVAFVGEAQEAAFDRCTARTRRISLTSTPTPNATLYEVSPGDHALLMYTSGTTGRPKGVVHTQSSLLAGGWTPTISHGLAPTDRGLCVLPICHINGLCVSVMGALISGGSLAISERFSARRFWQDAGDTRATWFSVVPTIISHLLHNETNPDDATRARLRFGRSASSALAPEVQTAFETRFEVPIIETMGLTETAAQILSNPLPPATRKIGSPGVAFGNEVAVLGPDLLPVSSGTEGEIAVRGPNVMLEYLHNPDATAATFAPGKWLRTGDLGRVDADGYVFVTGRLKELIIKGGENIAPREIDDALYTHADVIEAAAFARPCASYGERVEAAVKLRDGSPLTSDDLISICTRHLGAFKAPDHVHFLQDLPKGPSGKIQRLKLAELTQAAVISK